MTCHGLTLLEPQFDFKYIESLHFSDFLNGLDFKTIILISLVHRCIDQILIQKLKG